MPYACRMLLLGAAAALLAAPYAAGQQSATGKMKAFPREEPGSLPGYCPTRGAAARDWQAGEIEGCTMLDLYSQGINATVMTELSIILALHGARQSVPAPPCCKLPDRPSPDRYTCFLRFTGTQVTWLELARQMLTDPEHRWEDPEYNAEATEGIEAVADMLDANRQINTVRLGENHLGPAHASVIAPALRGKSGLTVLLLDKNEIGAIGAKSLADALGASESHVTELDLASNSLGDEGAAAVGAALATSPSVAIISLEGNSIGPDGVSPSFHSALKINTQLERLVLRSNQVGSAGAVAMAGGLAENPASGLLSMDMFANGLEDDAAEALAAALRAPGVQLQELGLAKNKLGDEGATALAKALESNAALPLRTLILAGNQIGDIGAAALLAALKANTMLTTLDVSFICK